MEIINILGKTPIEVATGDFFKNLVSGDILPARGTEGNDDEATWGDVEDEEDQEQILFGKETASEIIRQRRERNAVIRACTSIAHSPPRVQGGRPPRCQSSRPKGTERCEDQGGC
jgi:hypothetical protein